MIPAPLPEDVARESARAKQTIKADPETLERLRAHVASKCEEAAERVAATKRRALPHPLPPPSVNGTSAVVVLLLALILPGCCSVKAHDIDALFEAIQAERECVSVRPGFEAAVKKNRDAVDNHLAQQRRAHQ